MKLLGVRAKIAKGTHAIMRLLSSTTWEIKEFVSADAIPPYAIVSHTWGDDEVSFQDWQTVSSREVESKQGYKKIQYCCEQAVADEIGWIWMDTYVPSYMIC